MATAQSSRAVKLTGRYLSDLLLNEYKRVWYYKGDRNRVNVVNRLAVARVLAEHVERHPTDTRGYGTESDQIKDLVYRALNGTVLTRETLELFVEAFNMSEAHALALYELWGGIAPPRALIGDLPLLDVPKAASKGVAQFETVSRQELHYVGSEGLATHHRTIQMIRALADGYSTHRYVFDERDVEVTKVRGGTPSKPYHLKDEIWAVDLALPRALNSGDVTSMEFDTRFLRPEIFEPCFRYAAHQRLEKVVFRAEFHPERLPEHVWWTEWQDYRKPHIVVSHKVEVELDGEHGVQNYLDVLNNAVCGFSWEFN